MQVDFSKIKFDEQGLVPAVVQDAAINAVLMLAYMNGASLAKTVETGYTWFWSRSRQELWNMLPAAMCRRSSASIMIATVTACWSR